MSQRAFEAMMWVVFILFIGIVCWLDRPEDRHALDISLLDQQKVMARQGDHHNAVVLKEWHREQQIRDEIRLAGRR